MPTTRPRTLRLGGLSLTMTMDRMAAERLKSTFGIGRMIGHPPLHELDGDEPRLNGTRFEDIEWYHTLDLPNGVVTPGFVDHRDQVALYHLPESLAGKRCLDVATFDGFWAFEMEKRGASEVVGIDIHSRNDSDFPENWMPEYLGAEPAEMKGLGFAYARRALGSKARRKVLSVYELSPERVGTFDFVFLSDLLLHLREPFRAIERLWTVLKPGGTAIIADAYDTEFEAQGAGYATRFLVRLDEYSGCCWWSPSVSALQAMIHGARFTEVEEVNRFVLKGSKGEDVPKVVFQARKA